MRDSVIFSLKNKSWGAEQVSNYLLIILANVLTLLFFSTGFDIL